ncbi:hypothetical protein AAHC03_013509 [Spirometra sp. Aus1]
MSDEPGDPTFMTQLKKFKPCASEDIHGPTPFLSVHLLSPTMFVSRSVNANHSDLIHDIAFDYYGRRMATCSSDQMIKIWDLRDDQEWVCTARWRNHLGSVWRITWAHPEFGQVIATCSFDRTIAIWEEITGQSAGLGASAAGDQGVLDQTKWHGTQAATATSQSAATPVSTGLTPTSWVRRAHLVDPRTSVTGLQFAPRFLGLQLAAISTDGILRIYEAQDVMNLSQWTLQFDFGTKMNGSCLAWSQSRIDPPLIAVGSSSRDLTPAGTDVGMNQSTNQIVGGTYSEPSLVRGKLVIYEYSEGARHWQLVQDVAGLKEAVFDLAFAPSMGQSYHTLAVGSTEVLILRINFVDAAGEPPARDESDAASPGSALPERRSGAYAVSILARFNQHRGRVWRVSWNITGSLLASAGDDGTVRLWRSNFLNVWHPVSVVTPGGSAAPESGLPIPPPLFAAAAALGSEQSQRDPSLLGVSRGIPLDGSSSVKPVSSETSVSTIGSGIQSESKPVRFKKTGSMISSRNQVVWH